MKEELNMQKRGISLVVLVITIIILIIIAATVIISLSNTGVIGNANEAVASINLKQAKEVVQVAHFKGVKQGLKGEELKTYVINYLKKKGFEDLSEFDITVTDKSVSIKKHHQKNKKLNQQYLIHGKIV